jgi:hypothetical protein
VLQVVRGYTKKKSNNNKSLNEKKQKKAQELVPLYIYIFEKRFQGVHPSKCFTELDTKRRGGTTGEHVGTQKALTQCGRRVIESLTRRVEVL